MFAVLLRAAVQTLYKSGYKDSKNPGGNLSARPPRRYQYKRSKTGKNISCNYMCTIACGKAFPSRPELPRISRSKSRLYRTRLNPM
jgi:hypothetical protein